MQPVESPSLESMQHFSICPLRLTVAPGMSNRSEADLGAEVLDVLHEGVARELRTVVGDDPVRDPEAANNRPEEFDRGRAVTFLTGSTSGHFVNLSIATYKYSKPPTARGKGPRMSSPQTENGQDKGIVWRA